MVARCTVVQSLSRPRQSGFNAQTLHSFLVLFHLRKVVRLRILVEEERDKRVYMEIHYLHHCFARLGHNLLLQCTSPRRRIFWYLQVAVGEILLVTSCHRNAEKLWKPKLPGLSTDNTSLTEPFYNFFI